MARQHRLMSDDGHHVLVASAILSIALNPMIFRSLGAIERWLQRYPRLWAWLNSGAEERASEANLEVAGELSAGQQESQQALVVGFGPVGRNVDRLLREAGMTTVIIDINMDTVSDLRQQGHRAIFGDASRSAILELAGVKQASHLVLTLPQANHRTTIVSLARSLNPKLKILVRARYLRERSDLEQVGATAAIFEEAEAAVALARLVLADTGAGREEIDRTVRDIRLQLILENVSTLGTQAVRNIMIPWTRVRRLSNAASVDEVRRQLREQHYSRWPVIEAETGAPIGYLLAKDLIGLNSHDAEWANLIRPLGTVPANNDIESTLLHFQRESASMCVVRDREVPVGIVTIEDILEQVVGRIEDEYPRHPKIVLKDVLWTDPSLLNLTSETAESAITEMASRIPVDRLPLQVDIADLAIARERELPTGVGFGVAIPHARCPGLKRPLVVFGRSANGIEFGRPSNARVHLVFLLVTPAEEPEVQVLLLSQLASLAGRPEIRRQLRDAATVTEVVNMIAAAERTSDPVEQRRDVTHVSERI
jgi:mannitol/fructose-specific phosphotransferase system IIA component (Ntr-type)/voltage-gated potassium channel Kch